MFRICNFALGRSISMSRVPNFLIFSMVLVSFSCAHHRDVRPGAEGVHRVVISTEDGAEGSREALAQANHFCKEKQNGKMAAIVSEEKKYVGSMNEKDYQNAKMASKVAQGLGGATAVFGGRNERVAGGIVGIGGGGADGALGNGYNVEMKFKCQ